MKYKIVLATLLSLMLTACSIEITDTSDKNENDYNGDSTYLDIKLGEDYTDLSADITVLTTRTDLIADTDSEYDLPDYVKEFNKLYPKINVSFESATDYDFEIKNRLMSNSWGEVCYIPPIENSELSNYFEPYFTIEEGEKYYNAINSTTYNDMVYGIPCGIDVQGIVYNKKVWKVAGIKSRPKSPEEFLTDLQLIKNTTTTKVIPLYTNYEAGWPLVNWDFHAVGSSVGIDNYINDVLLTTKRPFVKSDDNTGPYEVYKLLYDCVSMGLVEDDPHTTSWELCKGRINNGEIGCMVLGSWAISQMKDAGDNADDISYMPFPMTINNKHYALSSSNYCYGINKNTDDNKKLASIIFVKFMVDKSGYDYNNGSIPVLKTNDYPEFLDLFNDVTLVSNNNINSDFEKLSNSTIGIYYDSKHLEEVVDAAIAGDSFDDIMNEWNDKWEKALTDN